MKNIKKKILIVDPYLDVLGGGEEHILSIGKIFEEKGYEVSLFWHDESILKSLESRLSINTKNFEVEKNERKGRGYDVLLYVTDGSYFIPKAKQNYIFCMYPQKSLYKSNLVNKLKWKNWNFFANSKYTSSYISKWVGKETRFIYPYISDEIFARYSPISSRKKVILSVGRFFSHLHAKNQHLLIDAFNRLQKNHSEFQDFQLVLIGGVKDEDEEYFNRVLELSKSNSNISVMKNVPHETILSYYSRASMYWHAAGLGADLSTHPEATEHLGITVLEAMASGLITFAHNSGGPKETIKNGKTGFLYNSIDELVEKTNYAYDQMDVLQSISEEAKKHCEEHFSKVVFEVRTAKYFGV